MIRMVMVPSLSVSPPFAGTKLMGTSGVSMMVTMTKYKDLKMQRKESVDTSNQNKMNLRPSGSLRWTLVVGD